MKGETIRIDVYVSRADERLNAFNRFSICSASTSGYFFGRASNRSIHFVTILVGDTRRMEVKDHEDKWQRHNIPLWCWSPVPMYWCAFDILLWIRRRQRRWQLQHCWLFQSLVYTHVKRMYAVCAPRASLLNKQDEKSKKRLGMRITFITIYSTYTLNLMVLLIFLNCWLFFFCPFRLGRSLSFDVHHRCIVGHYGCRSPICACNFSFHCCLFVFSPFHCWFMGNPWSH